MAYNTIPTGPNYQDNMGHDEAFNTPFILEHDTESNMVFITEAMVDISSLQHMFFALDRLDAARKWVQDQLDRAIDSNMASIDHWRELEDERLGHEEDPYDPDAHREDIQDTERMVYELLMDDSEPEHVPELIEATDEDLGEIGGRLSQSGQWLSDWVDDQDEG